MPTLHTFLAQKHEIVADCEAKLGYTFGRKHHCFAALNATGFRLRWSTDTPLAIKNDRLVILGDIMLDANLARKWFNNTTYNKSRRAWNRARSVTASDANLAFAGFSHGLDQCIALEPGTMAVSQKTMATTVEALIGAAYQDGGDLAVEQVVSQLGIDHEHFHESSASTWRTPGPFRKGARRPFCQSNYTPLGSDGCALANYGPAVIMVPVALTKTIPESSAWRHSGVILWFA